MNVWAIAFLGSLVCIGALLGIIAIMGWAIGDAMKDVETQIRSEDK
jgi:hypothetical protein